MCVTVFSAASVEWGGEQGERRVLGTWRWLWARQPAWLGCRRLPCRKQGERPQGKFKTYLFAAGLNYHKFSTSVFKL